MFVDILFSMIVVFLFVSPILVFIALFDDDDEEEGNGKGVE